MIAINELRVGNWVHHTNAWSYRQSDQLSSFDFQWNESDFYAACGECTIFLTDINPIPLTEEWLIKFGFELTDKVLWYHPDYLCELYNHSHLGGLRLFPGRFTGKNLFTCSTQKQIEFVHQLQNIFFALNDKELKPVTLTKEDLAKQIL